MSKRWFALCGVALGLAGPAGAAKELGLCVHQSTKVGLDATRDAGLQWVRIDVNWLEVQTAPNTFDWTLMDAVVDGARARGLEVLAVLAYGPKWASSGDMKNDGPTNDVPQAGKYQAFVTAAVQHFAGRVTHYEMWNEPNLGGFFEGTAQQYTSLILVPGADAVHAACPKCLVVGPGLATIGGQYDVWMDASLAAAKDKIDIVSGHIYADFPADNAQAGVTGDSFWNKLDAHRVIQLNGQVIYEGPLSLKEVMDKHAVQKPFWLTETGRQAAYGDVAAMDKQTLLYRRVLDGMVPRPWWTATIFYEGFDEPMSGYTWGVVLHDDQAQGGYRAKPVLDFLKKVTGSAPAFGGKGPECDDGIDDDGDGKTDFPADPECASKLGASEGGGGANPDAGMPDLGSGPGPDGGSNPADLAMGAGGKDGAATGGEDAGEEPPARVGGCTVGGAGPIGPVLVLVFAFVLALVTGRAGRRRRAPPPAPRG